MCGRSSDRAESTFWRIKFRKRRNRTGDPKIACPLLLYRVIMETSEKGQVMSQKYLSPFCEVENEAEWN